MLKIASDLGLERFQAQSKWEMSDNKFSEVKYEYIPWSRVWLLRFEIVSQ